MSCPLFVFMDDRLPFLLSLWVGYRPNDKSVRSASQTGQLITAYIYPVVAIPVPEVYTNWDQVLSGQAASESLLWLGYTLSCSNSPRRVRMDGNLRWRDQGS